ncbi:MAG: hypothetical protein A2945_01530 [Candidatus Liptonbacteria bacterium RIFCSPLOWO2_01_FULL_52_25]|uniref:Uncharacterized protein n=1 Tax=Candidatus Liptonbacteria bacterium RIFCSPLOWO2_01_FULL_52_25 TaxID=1798650 RepID=A0A1G2CFT8_9BACT|nr:MAG: hypothetical protein A2945_01530 [Candidatus Liptonbacteria bacterium RIFCSPLOWO2_01_FULL_52_25]
MAGKQKKIIIVAVVTLALIAAVGFWYWQSRNATPATPTTNAPGTSPTQTDTISVVEEAGESIGAVIFEKTQDPLKENIPETNPLKRVMINPF